MFNLNQTIYSGGQNLKFPVITKIDKKKKNKIKKNGNLILAYRGTRPS